MQAARVMTDFRARFLGKVSPVHFFWGSFDLAVTRFSGRTAPPPTSVTPNVANWVMAEAYSHEVSSCGFWPGNGGYGRAAFYVYAYPEPQGYGDTRLTMADGFYDKNVGQFILPYDCVREARDPDALLLGFLQETYAAAADLAKWNSRGAGAEDLIRSSASTTSPWRRARSARRFSAHWASAPSVARRTGFLSSLLPLRRAHGITRTLNRLWVRLVFGSVHSSRGGITFAHVRAVLCASIIFGSAEVVDFRSQIDPHNSIGGAAGLSLSFG